MKVWKDKINNKNIFLKNDTDIIEYMFKNNLDMDDVQFIFEDGYNSFNEVN